MSDSSSSKDSPPNESSNDSTDFDSSTPSKDTESPPPESESESPPPPPPKFSSPSDNSESPPSRPPPPQSSSPPSPPPPSKSPPPSSSNISPPPPDLSSSPPPPSQDGESSSPPPPKSSSPPPEEEKAPPPPPSTSKLVFAPPPKDQSPSPTNATGLSKISPPPPPAVTVPPPSPPSNSSSVIVTLVPASTPQPPSPTIQNLSPPKTGNRSTPVTPTPKTNAASTPVKPSPSTQSGASTSTPRSTTSSSSSSKPPPPRVQSDKFRVQHSVGPIIGVTLVVVLLSLLATFFVMVMRKKRKMEKMYYQPPPYNVSVRSDGYYYRTANSIANSSHSSSYYASQQMSSCASGIMYDSNRGYGLHQGPPDPTGSRSCFTYEELMDITHGFAQENVIGEGGFGCVYKGVLPDGRRVAVKQLKAGSGQGEREFRAEVEIISRVHHRHLVSLVGYCIVDYHRLLVCEFVPNGTLEHHLHGKGLPVLEWSKRLKIAIGSARGLAYLHEDCHPRIIHRDIKSANILLDNCFEAQVADFGLAKLSNDTNTHVSTRVMGTFGYMAPEYASSGKLTDRSDVFSFGVVLLELITGRKPVDASQPLGDESLVEWARPLLVHAIESGNFDKLVDPRLEDNYAKTEMSRMIEAAAACVRHSAPKRPRMVQVVRALDTDGDMADLTNGVKVGQSQVFNSGQYSADIRKFRQMAFASGEYESSEYGYSGELSCRSAAHSGELRPNSLPPVDESAPGYSSSQDSETNAIYRRDRNSGRGNYRQSGRGFP